MKGRTELQKAIESRDLTRTEIVHIAKGIVYDYGRLHVAVCPKQLYETATSENVPKDEDWQPIWTERMDANMDALGHEVFKQSERVWDFLGMDRVPSLV